MKMLKAILMFIIQIQIKDLNLFKDSSLLLDIFYFLFSFLFAGVEPSDEIVTALKQGKSSDLVWFQSIDELQQQLVPALIARGVARGLLIDVNFF